MRKAAVTSSQLTESLSLSDKGLESSWWTLGWVGEWGCCVCICVYSWCESFRVCVCVCLWELNFAFYALWPGCNVANIAVKGELDGGGAIHHRLCKSSSFK